MENCKLQAIHSNTEENPLFNLTWLHTLVLYVQFPGSIWS